MNSNGVDGLIKQQKHNNMNENFPIIFVMGGLIFLFGFVAGGALSGSQWQSQAVKAGAAEWIADENGNAKFQFKTK